MKFNGKQLKNIAHKLATTQFQHGWQWVVEFQGLGGIKPPANFEIYAKSIEHGGATIEYEEKQVGANTINSPTHKTAGTVTIMIRDNERAECEEFFKKLVAKVVNNDGTVNLPKDYTFELVMYRLLADDSRVKYKTWQVSIAEYGGFTRGVDAVGEFVSYPVVFKKYKALSNKE